MEKVPFIPNHIYNRRNDIHGIYGGNWQSGICPAAKFPYIFIFTGKSGGQHGYEDQWDNENVFTYTGEGQQGDMTFTRGNLALRESLNNGKRVFLFEAVSKGLVKFISEVEYFDCDYFETKDTSNKLRTGIKFFFKRKGAYLNLQPDDIKPVVVSDPIDDIYQPLDRLPNETERSGLVTSRVGQGAYRKRIIHRWEYQCAVTGFNKLNVLIASHIVPWASANDEERLDVNNGILLSPNYDALFDRHLMSFDKNGSILLSDSISTEAYLKIGVTGLEKIKGLNSVNHEYLERHRIHLI
jgi:5-methylcytosine-specific restriction protein A